jgi:hypothetical protein
MLKCSRVFGLLRCEWKANRKKSERQKERTLQHVATQNQIAANASENFALAHVNGRSRGWLLILSEAKNL